MNESPIVVDRLTKRFGQFCAVDNVSFEVGRGEVYGWLGPNGAGKTTTIRMLLGLLKATAGTARVLGYDPMSDAKSIHTRVGYMSQLFTLYNDLTVSENIRFYGRAYGLSRLDLRHRHVEIVEMAGLRGRELRHGRRAEGLLLVGIGFRRVHSGVAEHDVERVGNRGDRRFEPARTPRNIWIGSHVLRGDLHRPQPGLPEDRGE